MKVIEVDELKWQAIRTELGNASLFEEPAFVKLIAQAFDVSAHYIVVEHKEHPVLAIVNYTRGKRIVHPYTGLFTGLIVDKNLSEQSYITSFDALQRYLSSNYKDISLQLSFQYQDIRPFLWNNYQITPRYTYHLDLNTVHYAENVQRNLKKAEKGEFTIAELNDFETAFSFNQADLKQYGMSRSRIKKIYCFFELCYQKGYVKLYGVYDQGKLSSSTIILLDTFQQRAYLSLLSKVNQGTEQHTLLYDYLVTTLKEQGISSFDLCGANTKPIALFKSRFNPQLIHYFNARYHHLYSWQRSFTHLLEKALHKL